MRKRKTAGRPRKSKASTKDILGTPRPANSVPSRWKRYYARLLQLRAGLERSQGSLAADALEEAPSFSMHMADAGTDAFDRDFALGMLSSEQDAVYQIEEALERIHNGTYGKCELTGKPIERARLEAIPWTRFSAEAERQLEKEGAVRRAGLGPRDTVAKPDHTPTSEAEED